MAHRQFSSAITLMLSLIGVTGWAQTVTVTVNTAKTYQTMVGWEAVAQAGQVMESNTATGKSNDNPKFALYKDALFDRAVDELGLNRVRLELYSGSENSTDWFGKYMNGEIDFDTWLHTHGYEIFNDNDNANSANSAGFHFSHLDHQIDKVIIPLRQRLLARGEKLFVNMKYVDSGASSFEHKSNPAEYGELILQAFLHMQSKYGFVPDVMEVVLEPDNPSVSWSSTQVANALVAAGARLKAAGFTPRFAAPSVTNSGNAVSYFNQIIGTQGATEHIKELAYHRYDGTSGNLNAIAVAAKQAGVQTAMLELTGADESTLLQDLTLANVSSWEEFALAYASSDNGYQYYVIDETQNPPTVTLGKIARKLRQYFRYVRSGSVRVDATANDGGYEPVAFVNTNGGAVVVIKAAGPRNFSISGLPPGTYGLNSATDSNYNIEGTAKTITSGQPFTGSFSAAGVYTIYDKEVVAIPDGFTSGLDGSIAQFDAPVAGDGSVAPPSGSGCSYASAETMPSFAALLFVVAGYLLVVRRARRPIK